MNRVVLTLGLAAMGMGWLYPWSALIGLWTDGSQPRPLLSATSVFALVLLGALSTHLLGRRANGGQVSRIGLASLAVIAVVVAVRADQYPTAGGLDWVGPLFGALATAIGQLTPTVLAFALGLYLWWRGVRLGSQTATFNDIESAFRWGIGALVAFGLVMAVSTQPRELTLIQTQTTPFVIGFFFVSLLTLALGRLESLRTRTRALSINTQWFGVLIVAAGGVVLVALLAAQVLSFDLLVVVTRPLFDLLGEVLLLLIYAVVIPLAYVLEWLIYLVLSLVRATANQPPPRAPEPADIDNFLQRFFAEQVPPELLATLKAAGAAAMIGVALLVIARALSRWRPSTADADATNEERDSLWDAPRIRALLIDLLRRLLRRAGLVQAPTAGSPPLASAPSGTTELSSVRELYVQLLRLGHTVGVSRSATTTPHEHEPALAQALEPNQSIHELTEAYVRVRYAEFASAQAEATALRQELEQLRPRRAPD